MGVEFHCLCAGEQFPRALISCQLLQCRKPGVSEQCGRRALQSIAGGHDAVRSAIAVEQVAKMRMRDERHVSQRNQHSVRSSPADGSETERDRVTYAGFGLHIFDDLERRPREPGAPGNSGDDDPGMERNRRQGLRRVQGQGHPAELCGELVRLSEAARSSGGEQQCCNFHAISPALP